MLLRDWMRNQRWPAKKLAAEIRRITGSQVPVSTICSWRRGLCIPRYEMRSAIDYITDGQVLYADFAMHAQEVAA